MPEDNDTSGVVVPLPTEKLKVGEEHVDVISMTLSPHDVVEAFSGFFERAMANKPTLSDLDDRQAAFLALMTGYRQAVSGIAGPEADVAMVELFAMASLLDHAQQAKAKAEEHEKRRKGGYL